MTELQVKAKKGSLKKFFAMFLAVCVCMTTINVNAGLLLKEEKGQVKITLQETLKVEEGQETTLTATATQDVTKSEAVVSGGNGNEVIVTSDNGYVVSGGNGNEVIVTKDTASTKDVDITWAVVDSKTATLDKTTGTSVKVKGVKEGTTTITVTAGGKTAECKVTVTAAQKDTTVHANKVTLTPNPVNLKMGKTTTQQLTAKIEPAKAVEKIAKWESSNPKVATVSNSGLVTAVAAGTATITATTGNNVKGTCTVNVAKADDPTTPPPADTKVSATKVTLNAKNVYIPASKSFTVKATVAPKNSTDKVTWKSAKTSVAKVSSKGKITAQKKAAGKSTTVTATAGKKSAKVTVYVVKSAKAAALADASVTAGKKVTLKFTALNAATSSVKWSTSNKKIATVSNGVVTGKKQGVATITAKIGKKSVKCVVAVSKKGTSLTLKKTSATVKVGKTTKIAKKKIGRKDAIKSYKSSNKKVATVDKNGKVKGKKKGSAVITVQTKKGAYATFRVTVK